MVAGRFGCWHAGHGCAAAVRARVAALLVLSSHSQGGGARQRGAAGFHPSLAPLTQRDSPPPYPLAVSYVVVRVAAIAIRGAWGVSWAAIPACVRCAARGFGCAVPLAPAQAAAMCGAKWSSC